MAKYKIFRLKHFATPTHIAKTIWFSGWVEPKWKQIAVSQLKLYNLLSFFPYFFKVSQLCKRCELMFLFESVFNSKETVCFQKWVPWASVMKQRFTVTDKFFLVLAAGKHITAVHWLLCIREICCMFQAGSWLKIWLTSWLLASG